MSIPMMIFGEKDCFAIEAMIEPGLIPPSTPWGRMCIWIRGQALGNINEEYCGLDQSFDSLMRLVENLNSLWLEEFEDLSGLELIDFLDARLYGWCGDEEIEDERSIEEMKVDADRYWLFSILTNWGEQFDRMEKTFFFNPPGGEIRVLSRSFPREEGYCFSIPVESFCASVVAANSWFQQQRNSLSGARHA